MSDVVLNRKERGLGSLRVLRLPPSRQRLEGPTLKAQWWLAPVLRIQVVSRKCTQACECIMKKSPCDRCARMTHTHTFKVNCLFLPSCSQTRGSCYLGIECLRVTFTYWTEIIICKRRSGATPVSLRERLTFSVRTRFVEYADEISPRRSVWTVFVPWCLSQA